MLKMTGAFLKLNNGYQVMNIDKRQLVKTFMGKQNYFAFNSLGSWNPL